MKKIIILTLIILFIFTTPTFAFLGFIGDVIESQTPQPMYRVPGGQEIEYMLKTIKQVQLMINQVESLKNMGEQGLDQSALLSKMLGNSQLAGIVGTDFSSYSSEDWEKVIYDNIEDLFTELDTTVEETGEIPEEQADEIRKEVESRVIDPVDTAVSDLKNQFENEEIPSYTREEREEIFKEKVKELEKDLNLTVEYYVEIDKTYGGKSEYENYIKKENQTLNNISSKLEGNLDNASLPMIMKSLNVLMVQQNRINLKVVQALSDLNEQVGRIGETYQKGNIGNNFMEIDRKFNY